MRGFSVPAQTNLSCEMYSERNSQVLLGKQEMEETVSIEFGQPLPQQLFSWSDEEFLQAIQWRVKPTGDLMKGAQAGDLNRFSKGLYSRLKEIAKQKKQGKHAAEMLWASLWSEEACEETCRTSDLINLIKSARALPGKTQKKSKNGKRKKTPQKTPQLSWDEVSRLLVGWLDQVSVSDPLRPYELLLLTELMENVGYRLAPSTLVSVWRHCLFAAASLCFNLEETDFSEVSEDQVILVSGELPWRLGFLFSEISGAKTFVNWVNKICAIVFSIEPITTEHPMQIFFPVWISGWLP